MFKNLMTLLLALLFVCAGRAAAQVALPPENGPAPKEGQETATKDTLPPEEVEFVKATMEKVKTDDPATIEAAEKAFVERGEKVVKALAEALKTVVKDGNNEQAAPMANALVILKYKYDPREKIREFVKKQKEYENQEVKNTINPRIIISMDLNWFKSGFYLVRFRQYPVARMVAPPLAANNIFALDLKGNVTLITEPKDLMNYLAGIRKSVKADEDFKSLMKAYLRLTQELANDGMLRFTIPDDQIKIDKKDDGTTVVTGKAVVDERGGNAGALEATLTFDKEGKLVDMKEDQKIRVGMRPKCQSTKLLDKDPIVRYMARESLLIMGADARDYLFEQRAKSSPELQKAIDDIWQEILKNEREFPRKK